MTEWRLFRKTTFTEMAQINCASDLPDDPRVWKAPNALGFDVKTREGIVLNTPWGSWLAKDASGDFYPIAADIHARTYDEYVSIAGHAPLGPE